MMNSDRLFRKRFHKKTEITMYTKCYISWVRLVRVFLLFLAMSYLVLVNNCRTMFIFAKLFCSHQITLALEYKFKMCWQYCCCCRCRCRCHLRSSCLPPSSYQRDSGEAKIESRGSEDEHVYMFGGSDTDKLTLYALWVTYCVCVCSCACDGISIVH